MKNCYLAILFFTFGFVSDRAHANSESWRGPYLGVQYSYSNINNNAGIGAAPFTVWNDLSASGGLYGFQLGYNHPINSSWIVGLEVDAAFGHLHAGQYVPGLAIYAADYRGLGTARSRLGYSTGPWLLYGTGGFAWSVINSDFNFGNTFSVTRPHIGWTAGLGVEYALSKQWSARIEYLYFDFGFSGSYLQGVGSPQAYVSANALRLAANYRFNNSSRSTNETTLSNPNWSGLYGGIHVGHSWKSFSAYYQFLGTTDLYEIPTPAAGVYTGYNWAVSNFWLIGIESDASWGPAKSSIGDRFVELDWSGSIRVRAGAIAENTLYYATGGFAWTHAKSSTAPPNISHDVTMFGWVIGGGIERAISKNWSGRIEYILSRYEMKDSQTISLIAHEVESHALRIGLTYRN